MNDEPKTKRPAFRRCDCEDFSLTIKRIDIQTRKSRYRDPLKNMVADVLLGTQYGKPILMWEAKCSKCEKLYWVETRNSMKEKLKETGFPADKSAMQSRCRRTG